jgi:hypothetical protein
MQQFEVTEQVARRAATLLQEYRRSHSGILLNPTGSQDRGGRRAEERPIRRRDNPVLVQQCKGDPVEFRDDEGIRADTTVENLARLSYASCSTHHRHPGSHRLRES